MIDSKDQKTKSTKD